MLINGTKPPAPPHITLRGVNSKTFDLDVGAQKNGAPDPMDITGYRFEIQSKEMHRNNGGKWTFAHVVTKDFTDGVFYLFIFFASFMYIQISYEFTYEFDQFQV